jgi:hypothetical protein
LLLVFPAPSPSPFPYQPSTEVYDDPVMMSSRRRCQTTVDMSGRLITHQFDTAYLVLLIKIGDVA